MAQLTGVAINRLDGGLGRKNPALDNVVALVANMVLDGLIANKTYKLIQLSDAEALGITPAYDANHKVLVHHQLSEIFRLAPQATVYLIPTTGKDEIASVLPSILPLIRSQKDIKGIGFIGYNDTVKNIPEIAEKVQKDLITALFDESRYIDFVLLEGKAEAGKTYANTLTDLREKNAPQVSVVIAQDPQIASIDTAYKTYAGVGSALGMLCVRRVNENIGSVNIQNKPEGKKGTPDYPLTDTATKRWLSATLSDGTPISKLSKKDLKALEDKGYIFASSYAGYGGIFFNNAPTAVAKASDYGFIENNRTWNKAVRLIRKTLIPEVKGIVKKDPQTGFIKSTTISRWQGLLNKALEQMVIADEISGFQIYIDPKQYPSEDAPLKITAQVVKDAIVHSFEVNLGYTLKTQ